MIKRITHDILLVVANSGFTPFGGKLALVQSGSPDGGFLHNRWPSHLVALIDAKNWSSRLIVEIYCNLGLQTLFKVLCS